MATANLNFHSYFSIFTTSDSTASASEYNPFDEDNHGTYTSTSVASPDITYTSGDGRVTFGAGGIYLVVFEIPSTVNGTTAVTANIKINGTAVYTSDSVYAAASVDPRNYTFHTVIDVKANDYLEVTIDAGSATIVAENGTSLILLKANGDYGSILYTADADAGASATEIAIGDSDNGGTVTSKLNNVTFAASSGKLTPDNTRKFLMFSTLVALVDTSGEATHKLYANNSAIDDLPAYLRTDSDPFELSYGLLKSLTASQTASSRVTGAGTITVKKGTAFSIFDITNNSGTDPSAFLSLTQDSDSAAMTSGDKILFDSTSGTDVDAVTARVTSTGITYTAAGGTFVVSTAGKYFLLCSVGIGTATQSTGRTVTVKNGSTAIFTAPWYFHKQRDPQEKTICLIVDAAASDSFTFIVTNPYGKFDAGTAITMFKVDDLKDLTLQTTPLKQIADNYTINTLDSDVMGNQRDNVTGKVFPFSLGQSGPRTLRGRTTSYSPSMGGKVKK